MLSFKEYLIKEAQNPGFFSGIKDFAKDTVSGALDARYRRPSLNNIKLPVLNRSPRELQRSFNKYTGKNFINKWTKSSRWNQWAKRKVGYYNNQKDSTLGKALRVGRQLSQGRIALPLARALPKLPSFSATLARGRASKWKPEEDL